MDGLLGLVGIEKGDMDLSVSECRTALGDMVSYIT